LFVDAGKCLKYSSIKDDVATEVENSAKEVLTVLIKLTSKNSLKQLKERVKHLKQVIKI